ncbi:MAG: tetratricopeptide repeat protein [bacterium]
MKCPQCGFENPATNKFCGECGFNLHSYTSIERIDLLKKSIPENLVKKIISTKDTAAKERRNVTVVFTDISGFTTMSEKLDPEELTALMNECFKKLGLMVYRYEGIIDKFIGDCIMAIFGAPVSHEDDPERAVLASIDMQTALEQINKKLGEEFKKLEIHTGINTGEVIAGKVGSDLQMEYTVMGDTVNVAQRLKDIAAPGTILVGPETYQRTKHAFDFIQLEPIQLKGKEEKIVPFEVVGKKWGSEYGCGTFRSALVGRENELNRLKSAAKKIKERSRVFFIKGEIGVGKSRLLYEFKKYLGLSKSKVAVFDGRGISYESLIPYKTFATCLHNYFIPASVHPDEMKKAVVNNLKSILNTEYDETAPYILKLMNLELNEKEQKKIEYLDAHSLQLQILLAAATLFERISVENPIVLMIDDIQWLDSGSLEIINFLLPLLKKLKLLFCFSYRAGEFKEVQKFLNFVSIDYADFIEDLVLNNLSYDAGANLIKNLIGEEIDEELAKYIFSRTGGNPFFIEELCRQIMETNILQDKKKMDLNRITLPGSIEAVVTARCDGLSKEAKYLLKIASIIGCSFPKTLLEEIVKEKEVLNHLEELEGADLLIRVVQKNDIYYTFRHPIFQEVTYRSLLRSERIIYHKIIAETIESKFLNAIEGSAGLLAHHYYECREFPRATDFALKAGDQAASLYANEEAIRYYELASNIADDEEKKAEALEKLADTLFLKSAENSRILNSYEQAKVLSKDRLYKARINGKIASVYLRTGQIDKGIEMMQATIKDIENEDSFVLAQLSYQLADILLESKSESKQAEEVADFGIRVARRIKDQKAETLGVRMKAQILWRQGRSDEALKILNSNLPLFEKMEDPKIQASFYILIGSVYRTAGDLKKAIEYCQRSNEISQKIGNQRFLALGYNNLGIYYELSGNIESGLEFYQKSLEIRKKVGDKRGEAIGYFNIGTLRARTGDKNSALEAYEDSLKIAREINDVRTLFSCIVAIATIMIENDEPAKVLDYIKDAEKIFQEKNEQWMECEILYFYGKYFLQINDYERAKEHILKAVNLATTQANKELLARYYSLLADVCLQSNNIQTIQYAQESLKISQQSNDKEMEIYSLLVLGKAQATLNKDPETGVKLIKKAIALAKESNFEILYADALLAVGEVMSFEQKSKLAMNYLTQAKKIYQECDYRAKLKHAEAILRKISD